MLLLFVRYGYGGFEINEVPYYSASSGVGWLEAGGVLALANIRGGGEYGPKWHQAALKENRNKAYEDFIGIAVSILSHKRTQLHISTHSLTFSFCVWLFLLCSFSSWLCRRT